MSNMQLVAFSLCLFTISVINMSWQIFILAYILINYEQLFGRDKNHLEEQCRPVFIYTIGIIVDNCLMLIAVVSSGISYTIFQLRNDYSINLIATYTFGWSIYGIFALLFKLFNCLNPDVVSEAHNEGQLYRAFPFWSSIFVLITNLIILLITIAIGRRLSIYLHKVGPLQFHRTAPDEIEETIGVSETHESDETQKALQLTNHKQQHLKRVHFQFPHETFICDENDNNFV